MIKVASSQKIEELIRRNSTPVDCRLNVGGFQGLILEQIEEAKVPEEELKQEEPASQLKKPKVLIANDELFQLSILEALFIKAGFEITTAINGQEAYEHFFSNFGDGKPGFDLVVLDLCMPVSDGFEACRKILSLSRNRIERGIF